MSLAHEAPIDVLREEPRAVLALLELAGFPNPEWQNLSVEIVDSELSESVPSARHADLVMLLRDKSRRVRQTLIVEIQRNVDPEKLVSWPGYITCLYARHRVTTTLLVLTFESAVAKWARQRRSLGPNMMFAPLVLGPDELPEIASVEQALAHRDLSVLTALARLGTRDQARLARHEAEVTCVFEALLRTSESTVRKKYLSLLHGSASGGLRARLDSLLEEHAMSALEMIRNDGKAEGRAEAKALSVVTVLGARGIRLDESAGARIRNTRDLALLDRWLVRAATATTLSEVFAE